MPRFARTRGPRRRGDSHNLVRTRPRLIYPPELPPNYGTIARHVYPVAISDYEGVSDFTWSSGSTGGANYNVVSPTYTYADFNVLYYEATKTRAQVRNEGWSFVMQPIRWTVEAPATNGGAFDQWYNGSVDGTANNYYSHEPTPLYTANGYGIHPDTLLSGSHCQLVDDTLQVHQLDAGLFWCAPVRVRVGQQPEYEFATLQALSGNTFVPIMCDIEIAYLRHVINGTPVGDLQVAPGRGHASDTSINAAPWRIDPVVAGDTHELDVWYRIRRSPDLSYSSAGPAKFCAFVPTTRVSNGSRRIFGTSWGVPPGGPLVTFTRMILYRDVNMTPDFDHTSHTYDITLNGHSGWTLKDGSDGPHKIETVDDWVGTIGATGVWWTAPSSQTWIKQIYILWDRELAAVLILPNTDLIAAGCSVHPLIYHPSGSGYRSSTTSAEYGLINHGPAGLFNQGGTTTFDLKEWSVLPQNGGGAHRRTDGRKTGILPAIFEVPTSITVTRVAK